MKKRKKTGGKTPAIEVRKITRDEWIEEGTRLFGDDMKVWRFVCSNCKNIQTVNDFIELRDLGIFKGDPSSVYFSCIGRYDTRIPDGQVGELGDGRSPCNYTHGGLFCLAKTFIVIDAKENPVFEFDKSEVAPMIENEKPDAGAHDPDLESSNGGSDEKKAIQTI